MGSDGGAAPLGVDQLFELTIGSADYVNVHAQLRHRTRVMAFQKRRLGRQLPAVGPDSTG